MSKAARGFTLIELVVVIVILGILAAFAVPKFMGLESQARAASTQALGGSIKSAAALAHSVAVAGGLAGSDPISVEGTNVAMVHHYPAAAALASTLQDTTGFAPTVAGTSVTFDRVGATTAATCRVVYTEPTAAGLAPTVTVTATAVGCQ